MKSLTMFSRVLMFALALFQVTNLFVVSQAQAQNLTSPSNPYQLLARRTESLLKKSSSDERLQFVNEAAEILRQLTPEQQINLIDSVTSGLEEALRAQDQKVKDLHYLRTVSAVPLVVGALLLAAFAKWNDGDNPKMEARFLFVFGGITMIGLIAVMMTDDAGSIEADQLKAMQGNMVELKQKLAELRASIVLSAKASGL